jgi:hypothetical protein
MSRSTIKLSSNRQSTGSRGCETMRIVPDFSLTIQAGMEYRPPFGLRLTRWRTSANQCSPMISTDLPFNG